MKELSYTKTPNLPSRNVQHMLVDYRIQAESVRALRLFGVHLIFTKPIPALHTAVSGHPDMGIHHLGENLFCCAPEVAQYYQAVLPNADIICGDTVLGRNYPADIAYNVGRVGNTLFHNLKYTDRKIYAYYEKIGVNLIHVNQGYSKCSICVISPNAIITSDIKIAKMADLHGIDVLCIGEKGIHLNGMSCGFIGGATGLYNENTLLVNGNIKLHPDYEQIADFCRKYHVEIYSLHNGIIEDIGSLIPLSE